MFTGPNFVKEGLVLYLDKNNPKSFPGDNHRYDLLTGTQYHQSTYSTSEWANDITDITISTIVKKESTYTGYAEHPISKWNSGTSNASFVLYHFGHYNNLYPNNDGDFRWFYTSSIGGWSGLTVDNNVPVGETFLTTFRFGGGEVSAWLNGEKKNSHTRTGEKLGVGGDGGMFLLDNELNNTYNSTSILSMFYNRALTEKEIKQNYNALKGRFNL